ncbi:BZ3500_MvSof-1268-A1-R1_Chr1-3g02274 [Microbotryum saponariae]|uniref:BZ3500_MvSof-1268-A1-R1_Chr1-3g02274 protein n=1 Tax=Microbotryum saponariae TaxID=289078 RepID=A0A2X0MUS3_9BASI|nr:BZ3500_MvSof-1268-A1-R1_Chr1-3g02274 [Microbotryum saponariae]SCZ95845.1 BZ3501_MvSof-1269-A2-R1_Chr1-3g01877 [Microbotryum saponariae]
MLLVFDLDLDRQPRLHRTVNLLLTSSTSTSTFASTSGFGVTGGFLVRQSAVQDVMTGINDESTTLSTKTASTGNAAGQVRLEDGDDGEEVGMCGRSLPRCTATPTMVLFFVFSLFG